MTGKRTLFFISAVMLAAAAVSAAPQQLDLSVLNKIAAKAESSTEMGLDENAVKSGATSLDNRKGDEAAARAVAESIKGFFLRSYEFPKGAAPKFDDLKPLTDQLKAPNWQRFLRNKERGEETEIWWHLTNGQIDGILLISLEDEELTVINGIGVTRIQDLNRLRYLGH